MEIHLRFIGIALVILAIVHIIFPKYFQWKMELKNVSLINKEMMYVHTFFIAFTVLLMGLLCLTSYEELMITPIGKKIAFGFFIFWFTRLIIQFFGYSSQLWKGKRLETVIHIFFAFLFTYFSAVFFYIFWK